jgi:hypothetical protein
MKRGDVVIARFHSATVFLHGETLAPGESYARLVGRTVNRRGFIVDLSGARVAVTAVRAAPTAVQP